MNWRYIYIASVVVLSYVLFLSWNAEKEIKQEFVEASSIEQNKNGEFCPLEKCWFCRNTKRKADCSG